MKAGPGQHSYAHAGLGAPGYLAGEMLKQAFGLDLVAVAFQGGGPAITSTIGGHTPVLFTSIATAAGHVKQGTVRALAVTGAQRSPALPDVPTLAKIGAPDQESDITSPASWHRAARRRRSSTGSIARSSRWWRCPTCARAFRRSASSRSEARRSNSPSGIEMGDRQVGQGHPRRRHQGAVRSNERSHFQ